MLIRPETERGAGKTTITEPLRSALPGCYIFDTDIILQVAALGWDTWRNTWLRLAHAIALNGRVTVLCGSLMPDQMDRRRGMLHRTILQPPVSRCQPGDAGRVHRRGAAGGR